MRHPSKKHNVARLRALLTRADKRRKRSVFSGFGFDQEHFAKLVGCSVHKLQNIETGRTKLDEGLARKISNETGVAVDWLLENNTRARAIANTRGKYTIEDYNERRALRDLGMPAPIGMYVSASGGEPTTIIFYAWMRAIFHSKDGDIALWKTGKFLEKLAEEYGYHRGVVSMPLKVAALRDHKLLWQQAVIGMRLAERYTREYRKGVRYTRKYFPSLRR